MKMGGSGEWRRLGTGSYGRVVVYSWQSGKAGKDVVRRWASHMIGGKE